MTPFEVDTRKKAWNWTPEAICPFSESSTLAPDRRLADELCGLRLVAVRLRLMVLTPRRTG